jgi:hypothetical protein
MTPYIGQHQFTSWQGRMRTSRRRVSVLEPPVGVDGAAVAYDGWTPEVSEITTKALAANLNAGNRMGDTYLAMLDDPPTAVQVGEPNGTTWASVLIIGVEIKVDVQLDGRAVVTATWRLLPTTV